MQEAFTGNLSAWVNLRYSHAALTTNAVEPLNLELQNLKLLIATPDGSLFASIIIVIWTGATYSCGLMDEARFRYRPVCQVGETEGTGCAIKDDVASLSGYPILFLARGEHSVSISGLRAVGVGSGIRVAGCP